MDTLIPYDSLAPDTLETILDDIVSRDGTDYGDYELSVAQKRQQALQSLKKGEAVLLFDTESETIKMVRKEDMTHYDLM
ncbi:YheU family protein [Marinomonas hwangdonensis]|uniref:YheU family protein n=1 Tax=Marinomonas hwangdonensis TaxID=1053647 RepID=A0A3M8QAX9_9GAMM|nr:YheU family protein [Marinomonas hwangdonensis]MDP5055952.1 YheU family protein [Marinomonas hwangdonensis]RNF52220.1 YheU family protein [Marinomonas hwangdonensis]